MSNNFWFTPTASKRPTFVVPVFGGGLGDVCPDASGNTAMRTRIAAGVAAAHVQGLPSWSPPVT